MIIILVAPARAIWEEMTIKWVKIIFGCKWHDHLHGQKNPKVKLSIPFIRIPTRIKRKNYKILLKKMTHSWIGIMTLKRTAFFKQLCLHIANNPCTSPVWGYAHWKVDPKFICNHRCPRIAETTLRWMTCLDF